MDKSNKPIKKKVLFLLEAFDKGGIEKVTLDIVNNLNPDKYDITVQTFWYGGHCQSLVNENVKVIPFFFKRYVRGIIRLIEYLPPKLLYMLFVRGKYDVEVAASDGGAAKVISGSTNKKSKKICWVHMDVVERGSQLKFTKKLFKAKKIYSKFDIIACVSKACEEKFIEKFGRFKEMRVVYNPLNQDEICAKSNEPVDDVIFSSSLNIISVGRLVEQKGYDRLIDCCDRLINNDKLDFNLYIIGEGPMRSTLENKIKEFNLTNHIFLTGFSDNPYKYVKRADIFVVSSRDESFSLAVGEAIILGKVILSTNCAGVNEWLENNKYGLMVDNDVESLYNGLKTIITNADLRETYSKNVKVKADKLDFNNALENFFKTLLLD